MQEDEIRSRFGVTTLPSEQIQELERVFGLQERYVHYEFAHQAEVDLHNHDYPAALIAAVVALESAHAAYVRTQLEARLPSDMRETEREQLLVRLLREHGIHSLIQITPYLFLPPKAQPSSEAIRKCVEGLEMRNAIMHAKVKKGHPEIRKFDSDKYLRVISGVLSVYETFARELELGRRPESP